MKAGDVEDKLGDHEKRIARMEQLHYRALLTVAVATPTILEAIRMLVQWGN